ncbi:hypothetical protein M9H77_28872 [Catharanthus roseus]|uniref:Uncharacterized protein n=1 Tax=Catharanthus roseus TaxID=4058 RepID=A0ACC0AHI8_CATRO|nr:hypothetical protein M9H77_28872 [Catharanthus roseus]
MGVCCIAKNPNESNILLTGSYDEYLRIWDMRSISQPVSQSCLCLGGGVWRIKYHPTIPDLVLTACMHNGFAIVKTKNGEAESIEAYNNKHGSLAYGADWQREKIQHKQGNSVVAHYMTGSFAFGFQKVTFLNDFFIFTNTFMFESFIFNYSYYLFFYYFICKFRIFRIFLYLEYIYL